MLPIAHRLRQEGDFRRVYRQGRPTHSHTIILRCVPNQLSVSRFGIVTSGKLSKKAVERNTARRQLREILRKNLHLIDAGQDCVIIPKKSFFSADFSEKNTDTLTCLKKAKLLNNANVS